MVRAIFFRSSRFTAGIVLTSLCPADALSLIAVNPLLHEIGRRLTEAGIDTSLVENTMRVNGAAES